MSVSKLMSPILVGLAVSFSGAAMAANGTTLGQEPPFQDRVYSGISKKAADNLKKLGYECSADQAKKSELELEKSRGDRPKPARPSSKKNKRGESPQETFTCQNITLTTLFGASPTGGENGDGIKGDPAPADSFAAGQRNDPAAPSNNSVTGGSDNSDVVLGVQGTPPFSEPFARYSFTLVSVNGYVPGGGGVAVPPVSPIPEPSTYALMGLGLGVVVWAARRRRENDASRAPA